MWRRPWVIFGLVAFTIAVAMICLFGSAIVRVQRQHAILMQIEALGGGYSYTPADDWGIPFAWQIPRHVDVIADASVVDITALLDLASALSDVTYISLENADTLSAQQLSVLCSMHTLTGLNLSAANISDADLKQLTELTQIQDLCLAGTKITDASLPELAKFQQLRTLDVRDTPMRYASIQRWSQTHPHCSVAWYHRFEASDS